MQLTPITKKNAKKDACLICINMSIYSFTIVIILNIVTLGAVQFLIIEAAVLSNLCWAEADGRPSRESGRKPRRSGGFARVGSLKCIRGAWIVSEASESA